MKFSLFVHMERADAAKPHRELFDEVSDLVLAAEAAGEPEVVRALQPSRDEEKQAYDWMTSNIKAVTERYVSLTTAPGATSSH